MPIGKHERHTQTPKHPHRQRTRWLLATGLLYLVAACGVPINTGGGSGDPLPIQEMAQALNDEPAEVKFSFQEIFQPEYTTDWHKSGQPFPSNRNGSRGGGSVFFESNSGDYHGRTQFEITPNTNSIQLPPIARGNSKLGIKLSAHLNCSQASAYTWPVVTEIGQDDSGELIELNDNPDPDDPICTFIWPGILAQRILPPTEQPTTLNDYFTALETHDFVHTHTIRMYSEPIRI